MVISLRIKRNLKRAAAGLMAVCMLCLAMMSVSSEGFSDISEHWAKNYIIQMIENGYINGYEDNTFRPDNAVTKAEGGKIMSEMFEIPASSDSGKMFSNLNPGIWYTKYAYTSKSLFDADMSDTFFGDRPITRLAAARAILLVYGFDFSSDSGSSKQYADYNADASEDEFTSKNAVISTVTDLKIMNGKDGSFCPEAALTRAEFCTLLIRTSDKYGKPSSMFLLGIKTAIGLGNSAGGGWGAADSSDPIAVRDTKPTQTPRAVPTPRPTQPPMTDDDIIEYRREVLRLVNVEREKEGLNALVGDDKLDAAAQGHSEDMAANNFFAHDNLKGEKFSDRIKKAGASYRCAGENIAAGHRDPADVVDAWMHSEGHRANILTPQFNKLGVGIAKDSKGCIYWTQDFTD